MEIWYSLWFVWKLTINQAVMFCNTREKVEWLTKKTKARHFTVVSLHGDITQKERDQVM